MHNNIKTRLPKPVKVALKRVTRGAISSAAVQRAARDLWSEIKIAKASWASHQAFQALSNVSNLKINLGCGTDIRLGWVNIDIMMTPPAGWNPAAHPDTGLLAYDLRQGLPLADQSCAFIYSSHFFEHLEYQHGLRLLQDCYRVLQPGGTFRLCMPNYRACFEAYLRNDRDFFSLVDYALAEPKIRLISDYMTYSIYQYGEHKCLYDEERFQSIFNRLGFCSITVTDFQADLDIGAELRRKYSYYIQAIK